MPPRARKTLRKFEFFGEKILTEPTDNIYIDRYSKAKPLNSAEKNKVDRIMSRLVRLGFRGNFLK